MAREEISNFSDDDLDDDDRILDEEDEGDDEDRGDVHDGGRRRRSRRDDDDLDEDADDADDDTDEDEDEDEESDLDLEDLERIASGDNRGMVPYPRLAAVVEQNHRLTEALATIATQQGAGAGKKDDTPPPVDIAKLREQYEEAVLEGDKEKSRTLAAQIDEAVLARAEERALKRVREDQEQQRQEEFKRQMDAASDIVLRKYPSLNDFQTDQDASDNMDRIVVERDLLMRRGVPGPKAMRMAADKVMAAVDGDGQRQRGGSARDKRRRKERESLRARARTASRIPPSTSGNGTGQRGRRPEERDVYTEREVAGMTERQKREARGDYDV